MVIVWNFQAPFSGSLCGFVSDFVFDAGFLSVSLCLQFVIQEIHL